VKLSATKEKRQIERLLGEEFDSLYQARRALKRESTPVAKKPAKKKAAPKKPAKKKGAKKPAPAPSKRPEAAPVERKTPAKKAPEKITTLDEWYNVYEDYDEYELVEYEAPEAY
jgi:phage protein D